MDFPALQNSSVWPALSPFGKQIFLPQGIFYWSGRAKAEAEINATVGTALDEDGGISHLNSAWGLFSEEFKKKASPKLFGYAPITGLPSLCEKWRNLILNGESEETVPLFSPIVTSGITNGLSIFGWLFLSPGERLLIQEKSWGNYKQIFSAICDIKLQSMPLGNSDGTVDVLALEKAMNKAASLQNKVVLLLNYPHNQTGFTPTPHEGEKLLNTIAQFAKNNPDIPVVVGFDDAYEGYVYDDKGDHNSLFLRLANLKLQNVVCVKLDGISKQFLAYGFRIGFITFAFPYENVGENSKNIQNELSSKVGGVIRGTISNSSHLAQAICDVLLENPEKVKAEREKTIQLLAERWQMFQGALQKASKKFGDMSKNIWVDPFNSGFFCFFNLNPRIDAAAVAERLISEYKVACVPSIEKRTDLCTGWNGIRVAFCGVQKKHLKRLAEAIYKAVSDIA